MPLSSKTPSALIPKERQILRLEKYETANWSLRRGDEEINKRITQKIYIFKQIANIYVFCFILLFTSSSSCRKDQFAVTYFSTSLIELIQVYNWEIRHHSLICWCGLTDILDTQANWHEDGEEGEKCFVFVFLLLTYVVIYYIRYYSSRPQTKLVAKSIGVFIASRRRLHWR